MLTKLRIANAQTGVDIYVVIRNEDDELWDGTEAVTYNASNESDYALDLTEQGSTGYYSVDIPTDLPAGTWHATYHQKYNSPTVSLQNDDRIYQKFFEWNGSEIIDDLGSSDSITDICNMALAHLGVTETINNFDTDTTEEAILCRRFYEIGRDKVLRAFGWPFATTFATLSLVEEDPTEEWQFSYRYPTDALAIRRILSGTRNETRQSRVSYRLSRDSGGLLIFSDMEDAICEYTLKVTSPATYPPDFKLALSYYLAHLIAPKLTRGDQFKLGDRAIKLFIAELQNAQSSSLNETMPDEEPLSEFERIRHGNIYGDDYRRYYGW